MSAPENAFSRVSPGPRRTAAALLVALCSLGVPRSASAESPDPQGLAPQTIHAPEFGWGSEVRLRVPFSLRSHADPIDGDRSADSLSAPEPSASYDYQPTETFLVSGLSFAGAHMIDNVLSRRTFASGTTAPTLVQALYVAAGVAYLQDAGPLVWTLFSTGLLTAHSLGHHFVPSASHHISTFHDVWAEGDNRLDVQSSAMGRASQGVLIMLDLSFAAVLVSSLRDGYRCGFTLRQTACAR